MTREEYNQNPNICRACGKPILCGEKDKVSHISKKIYCNRDCYFNYCYSLKNIVGIYCIKNKINNKVYIGQSTDITSRFRSHKSSLRRGNHYNSYLQKSWNKHGEDEFEFCILEECEIDMLDILERHYIDIYNAMDKNFGYNNETGGNMRKKSSAETKLKISKNHINVSGENNPMYGKKMSQESIIKTITNENYINRKVKGTDNWKCTLSEDDARSIKKYFSDGHKPYRGEITDIAKKYNTTIMVVSHIKNGHAWKWLEVS